MADLRTLAIAALVELARNPYELHAGRALAAAVLAEPDWQSRAESAEQRVTELEAALDRDKTGLAAALGQIRETVRGYSWLQDGRGSYAWDDDEYRREAGRALAAIEGIAAPALAASGTLATAALRTYRDQMQAMKDRAESAEREGRRSFGMSDGEAREAARV